MPRHSPNALRRLIRSPNRNAEANRPRPSRNDERHTQHFFSAGPGDNAQELPPAKDPAKGRPHKPIHNVKEQRTEDGEQRTEKDCPQAPELVPNDRLSGTRPALVELNKIEPITSCLQNKRSPN